MWLDGFVVPRRSTLTEAAVSGEEAVDGKARAPEEVGKGVGLGACLEGLNLDRREGGTSFTAEAWSR